MSSKLGFDVVDLLLDAVSVSELDMVFRVVSDAYPVLRGHLEERDKIKVLR